MVRKRLLADAQLARTDANVRGLGSAIEDVGEDERAAGVILQTVEKKAHDEFLPAIVKRRKRYQVELPRRVE